MLRKLLGLSEPNPVEIPEKLIRIYSMCYVLNIGQWFAKPLDSLGLAVALKFIIQ